jgi:hypothetical protein
MTGASLVHSALVCQPSSRVLLSQQVIDFSVVGVEKSVLVSHALHGFHELEITPDMASEQLSQRCSTQSGLESLTDK